MWERTWCVSRAWQLYLEDMRICCAKVLDYTRGLELPDFQANAMMYDAVVRNLEIPGEAAKNISDEIRLQHPQVEWRKIAGLRDVLAQAYFGLEDETLWDIVRNKLPVLRLQLQQIQGETS
jgi:uncharacterized protein with HEPN domain